MTREERKTLEIGMVVKCTLTGADKGRLFEVISIQEYGSDDCIVRMITLDRKPLAQMSITTRSPEADRRRQNPNENMMWIKSRNVKIVGYSSNYFLG